MQGPVLVIEDNPGDQRLITETLRSGLDSKLNIEIHQVTTLADGLKALQANIYAIILLDLGLPDSFGLESFKSVQEACPDTAVVVISGASDETLAQQCVQLGAQDYLVKGSIEPHTLVRTITFAERRQQRHQQQTVVSMLSQVRETLKSNTQILDEIRRLHEDRQEYLRNSIPPTPPPTPPPPPPTPPPLPPTPPPPPSSSSSSSSFPSLRTSLSGSFTKLPFAIFKPSPPKSTPPPASPPTTY
jgi:DNA-binding NarL/FixJ family response regulator